MKATPLPPNEELRQRLLRNLEIMDTAPEEMFDIITQATALICDSPLSMVSLVNETRQWFKSKAGQSASETSGEIEFCAHAILQDDVMVVTDASKDERFSDNPLVRDDPKIRFFAGAPLKLTETIRLGTLCVIDYQPRKLDNKQLTLLKLMAEQIVALIRLKLDKIETSRDFSTLVMVKQKLQYQKEMVEAILDNEPECVSILSPSGNIEQINKAGLDTLEVRSLAEAQKRKLVDYVHPEFRDRFGELASTVLSGNHATAEYRIRGARGTERWMESHAAPLHDQQGEISGLIAITRDITEIKDSQQQLVLAARVFTEAQEGIIITDAQSVIVDVNPAFCTITGYCRDEVIGRTPRILQSGIQGPEFYAALWKMLGASGHWKGEIWSRRKNGELYAELISINALRDEAGNVINYVALFMDITDIKKQQGGIPHAAI